MRINFESARNPWNRNVRTRSLSEGGKAAGGAHVPDMTRITIARTVWWRASKRASARVCACALCFLRLGRSDLYSARDIMHAAIYARCRKKAHSKGGFVMSAKQSSWPPAHRRQDVAELLLCIRRRVYYSCTQRLRHLHFEILLIYFARQRITMAIATPTRRRAEDLK
jgi:hypothetical protein